MADDGVEGEQGEGDEVGKEHGGRLVHLLWFVCGAFVYVVFVLRVGWYFFSRGCEF